VRQVAGLDAKNKLRPVCGWCNLAGTVVRHTAFLAIRNGTAIAVWRPTWSPVPHRVLWFTLAGTEPYSGRHTGYVTIQRIAVLIQSCGVDHPTW
jgi:hypothetical protein